MRFSIKMFVIVDTPDEKSAQIVGDKSWEQLRSLSTDMSVVPRTEITDIIVHPPKEIE